jgi:bifunctional UDP-N-acetylglucosamine pyrophosphorylase/glucosamine-1-phosphate N-acetyltransferase
MQQKVRVVIPAGGRSSRSGLAYPKSLYRLTGTPILVRIIQKVAQYDSRPVLIINPAHEPVFTRVLQEFNLNVDLVFQHEPKGMGHALLQADQLLHEEEHILLVWSDIPFLSETTIDHLAKCHFACQNHFSLATSIGTNCYTIVERVEGKLVSVKETRALGIPPAEKGERDIGLFFFKKQPVFALLAADAAGDYEAGKNEHGFLYIIGKVVATGAKVEGYPIALPIDILSFNTPEDLAQIESAMTGQTL